MGINFYSILFLFFFIFHDLSFAQEYGLAFLGQEVVQEERTGLDLSPNATLSFGEDTYLTFELSFDPGHKVYFGYIFRLIDENGKNIDLIYDERFEENKRFKLIIGEKVSDIVFDIPLQDLFLKWHTLRFNFNKHRNKITLFLGNEKLEQTFLFPADSHLKVLFGANDFQEYKVTDVPSMKVKQLSIHENQLLKYHWPLDDVQGNQVQETVKGSSAQVKNPSWIKKQHYEWKFLNSFIIQGAASMAFDAEAEEVHVVGEDALMTFSIPQVNLSSIPYQSGKQHLQRGNQSLYDTLDHRIYNFYMDQKLLTTFDWDLGVWDKVYQYPDVVTTFWHSNKFYSQYDGGLYMIGGYGQYTYHNQVYRFNVHEREWEEVQTTGTFTPRYLAALGTTVGGAYILGGYGSTTGQQFVNPRNLYDLVFFDEINKSFTTIHEIEKQDEFAFANSMIIDQEEDVYYALQFPNHVYNSSLQLVKGSLSTPKTQEVGNVIPYKFHDILSFADLYFAPKSKKFVAVTSLFDTARNETSIRIYTLLGPPLMKDDLAATIRPVVPYWVVWCIVPILLIGFGWWIRKGIMLKRNTPFPSNAQVETLPIDHATQTEDTALREEEQEKTTFGPKNSIYLFGLMQLYDANGNDITKLFAPLIKELFLLILLYTKHSGVGISSEKLTEILWFDKSVVSARNNRSVNIAKLKAILERIDGCVLTKETGYWKINLDKQFVYVDYTDYVSIVNAKQVLTKANVYELAKVTQRGAFLSNEEYDWLDKFKSEISHTLIDTYLHVASSINMQEDPEFIIELTNYIFQFDFVNEEAMVLKCKALGYLGKHSHVKLTYENFTREYKAIYGEAFNKTLQEIIG